MESDEGRIIKYNHPTKFNPAPYGCLWEVILDADQSILYIQTSKNAANPEWERSSTILQRVFEPLLNNSKFLFECLDVFGRNQRKDFLKIVKEILHTID